MTLPYSISDTCPEHGHRLTPSWAGAHGAARGWRGGLVAHRRIGTAVSMASASSRAAPVDGNGPK